MKKSIIIVFQLILLSQLGFCQLMPDFVPRINIKLAYGKWYRVDGVWADTGDGVRPDLEIFENDSVVIKQTMYINPCKYEFEGKLIGSKIRHISKLYCVDRVKQEMPLARTDTAHYEIVYLSENHLTLSGQGFTVSFQKEVEFSNIFRVMTSRKWATLALGYYPQQLNLECHADWQAKSNSIFWTWEFFRDGTLVISDGISNDTLKWTLRTDSILTIKSKSAPYENKVFKIKEIAPCNMKIKEVIGTTCKEDGNGGFIGRYSNNSDTLEKRMELMLMDNYYFQLYNILWDGSKIRQLIGKWELEKNKIILHPQEIFVQDNWKFERNMVIEMIRKEKKKSEYFELPLQNGDVAILMKISSIE